MALTSWRVCAHVQGSANVMVVAGGFSDYNAALAMMTALDISYNSCKLAPSKRFVFGIECYSEATLQAYPVNAGSFSGIEFTYAEPMKIDWSNLNFASKPPGHST